MELLDILETVKKHNDLIKELKIRDERITELEDEKQDLEEKLEEIEFQIVDLENELDKEKDISNKKKQPLREEIEQLKWDLGILVSKDQLPLFDLSATTKGAPK